MLIVIESIWFLLPAYMAILFPVLTRKLPFLNTPVDFGKKINGKPILGKNKTYRGLFFGFLAGLITVLIQIFLYRYPILQKISWINYSKVGIILGILLSAGALIGDLVKSFFKRRLKIKPSQPWIFFDQADYIFGSIYFVSLIYLPTIKQVIFLFITGTVIHLVSVWISYKLGIKKHWI